MEPINKNIWPIIYDYLGDSSHLCNVHWNCKGIDVTLALYEASKVNCMLTVTALQLCFNDVRPSMVLEIMCNAISHENDHMLKMLQNIIEWDYSGWETLVRFAIRKNKSISLHSLYYWSMKFKPTTDHALYAGECNSSVCLAYLIQRPINIPLCMIRAAMYDSIECVQVIHARNPTQTYTDCSFAARITAIVSAAPGHASVSR